MYFCIEIELNNCYLDHASLIFYRGILFTYAYLYLTFFFFLEHGVYENYKDRCQIPLTQNKCITLEPTKEIHAPNYSLYKLIIRLH